MAKVRQVHWQGELPLCSRCGDKPTVRFGDFQLKGKEHGVLCERCVGDVCDERFGPGRGSLYVRQDDGRWLRTKGDPDFVAYNHGTIFLLEPRTDSAREWCGEHLPETGDWAGMIPVEHRFIRDILHGIAEDGLTWRGL